MSIALTKRRFTVDDYQRMGQAGILSEGDRVELVDGEVVAMTPIGARHTACVNRATHAFVTAVGGNGIVQIQSPVRLDLYHEPEPDIVLLKPRDDFYASRLPGPGDILLIVEIADSSIEYDRDVKARIYAESGIPEYWLADLNANLVSRYTAPEQDAFRTIEPHHRGQSIAPQLLPACLIAVDVLLTE